MPTYRDRRLKPCATCKTKPVLEHWASGGPMYAVRCDNPDRPDSCDDGFIIQSAEIRRKQSDDGPNIRRNYETGKRNKRNMGRN